MRIKFHQTTTVVLILLCTCTSFGQAPDLGVASTFALFTAAGAFNGDVGTSVVGDIGTNVGAFTPPGIIIGQIHVSDAVSAQAAADVPIAYSDLAGRTCGAVLAVTLGNGQTLTPNIYCTGAASTINGTLTLDAAGDPDALFIFQIDGALATNVNSSIVLINGASLCNVFWQVNGEVDLGENSVFQGTIVAEGAINLLNGANLFGRGLSTAGAISTSANSVQLSSTCFCALTVTCPPASGGTFSCSANIAAGLVSDVLINSSCGATTVVITETSSGAGCAASPFVLIRTYTVTVDGGETTACVVTFTAIDNTPPVITCPAVVAVTECPATPTFPTDATATDICDANPAISSTDITTPGGLCPQEYSVTRTWTATDACGNAAQCSRTISVMDNTAPAITCPTVISLIECPATPTFPTDATATDICDANPVISSTDITTPGGLCPQEYSVTHTWTATDACGNAAQCSRTISVMDNTVPQISCPANVSVSCAANVPAPAPTSVITSDLCGGAVTVVLVGDVISSQTCPNRFTISRTYRATDLCGNSAECIQTITVNDQTPPNISCPANVSVSCAANVPAPAPASVITSDLCGGAVTVVLVGDVISNQTCANRFTIARTYRATDLCGNSAECIQTITINDQTPPNISCPANVSVSCAANVPAPAPASVITSYLCGGVVTVVLVGDVISSQTCPNRFSIARTYRATDLCGNSAECIQTITVNDQTPPNISCPANVSVSCAANVPAPAPASIITSDLCGGVVTVVLVGDVISNQTCANRFTISRTYRATDLCGNSAECIQIITVFDNTAPVFANIPVNTTVECFQVPPVPMPIATDNCTGPVTVVFLGEIQTQGVCPVLYTLTRTWIATDACGNASSISQVVTVIDTYAPQFVQSPLDVVIECDTLTNQDAYQDWLDNHGGATVFECSTVSWTIMPIPNNLDTSGCANTFQHFIRFIATDECGNAAFHDASFRVTDQTPPTFTVLPVNLEVDCTADGNGDADRLNWLEQFGFAEVSDQCGSVETQVAFVSEKQKCGNTYTRLYQFRATDKCGNTTYLTATFSVVDNTPPVIETCPPNKIFLYCEFEVPPPDTAGIVASDNCGPITISVESFTVGVGCVYSPRTTIYTYNVADECGNVSKCFQAFQVQDSFPPIYTGPDTLYVLCAADLPAAADVLGIIAPYMVDNCYEVICFNDDVAVSGANWITFCVKAKDLCGNWTDKFFVTFVATGGCKPICTAPQTVWGNPDDLINGMTAKAAIEQYLSLYGSLTAGKLGKTISVTSADCLFDLLPGSGSTTPLNTGNHTFSTASGCQQPASLLNDNGTLKNALASNVLVLQLNIWYNLTFNDRDLSVQLLSSLPPCLIDPIVLSKVQADFPNVQGLLYLSNDYLAGVGAFPPDFGHLMNMALDNLHQYWLDCQLHDPCATKTSVAGVLKTETQEGFELGQLQLDGSNYAGTMSSQFEASDVAGHYEFSDAMPIFGNYTVTPSAEGTAYTNGVTTYDLVLISKHIMGLEPLNSPYKMIAADANKSGNITTFDIVELRKLILGIYDRLPNNTAWRFVDQSFVFPDPAKPFATFFPEEKNVVGIQASQLQENFVSIKIGDVNGTAVANNIMSVNNRTEGTLLFDLQDRQVTAGETFDIRMTADQVVQGFQFTLNTTGLEVLEATGAHMKTGNFAVFAEEGSFTTSWELPEGAPAELAEWQLTCRATQAGKLSEMLRMSSRITKAEAYLPVRAGEVPNSGYLDVALRFQGSGNATINGVGFELYQNVPNPFVNKTLIGFHLPDDAQATLKVFDETGKMVHTQVGDFGKGYNAFVVEHRLMPVTGALYYQLETANHTATRRMIQAN